MTRNSIRNLVLLTACLAIQILSAVPTAASEGVPIGAAGGGIWTSGEYQSSDYGLNIDTNAAGANIVLVQGDTVTAMDGISITATVPWKLTVEDLNTGLNKSKMRRYVEGYVTPEVALSERMGVLVNNVGSNGASGVNFSTLTNATDLSTGVDIIENSGDYLGTIDLMYSQMVTVADNAGNYRIDLKYTLSPT